MIIELEQMREKHQDLLTGRVQLLGSIRHDEVRDVRTFPKNQLRTTLNLPISFSSRDICFLTPL